MEKSPERDHLLALNGLYRNRIRTIKNLLQAYGTAVETWKHIHETGMSDALERAKAENDFIDKHAIRVWSMDDADYPQQLRQCPDAPVILFGKGNIRTNTGKMVSIVGTRSCTERGKDLTRKFVTELTALVPDITIVSGLAYGIDIAAHKAALEIGIPTFIVAGHGLDRIYPALHRNVAVASLRDGGILTEYMSGIEPERYNFVARDRIIAGMADAVVVVESKQHGGALITAQMACDYSRPLFAFPGRPQDEAAQGCNFLIKEQKAALIENAQDMVDAMMWGSNNLPRPVQTEMVELSEPLTENETRLLNTLREQEDGIQINSLVVETEMPYAEISSLLMMMELKGLVKGLPGGFYRALK